MRKIRVLAITEATYLSSGYAQYWRYILRELHKNPKYEVIEFATFVDPVHNNLKDIPWTVIPNIPKDMPLEEFRNWSKEPMNNFGQFLFNEVAVRTRPDVVLHAGDWWMQKYVNESPYRKHFKYVWLAPCDSAPQNMEWIEDMARCDGIMTYCDWGKETIEKQCSKIKVYAAAPPSAQDHFIPMDKAAVKKHFNIREDVKFIGTVMRNQRRKLFPSLFESYRKFLDETGYKDIYLYCHTSYPDGSWKIPELIQEYGIADKVFFSFICKNCQYVFPSLYTDLATCRQCGGIGATMPNTMFGVSSEVLGQIYNMFDLYVQYANSEGFGLSQVEAASCGVPIMSVDYSAMSDVVRKLGGEPIKVKAMYKEMETGAFRAIPDDEHFIELLKSYFKKPSMIRNTLGLKARNNFLKNYKWEESAKRWSEIIDKVVNGEELWLRGGIPHQPEDLTNQMETMPNNEYARWLITKVAGWTDRAGSYSEMQLIRDLNYGYSTGIFSNTTHLDDATLYNSNSTNPFNRKMAYEHFRTIGQFNRNCEIRRLSELNTK